MSFLSEKLNDDFIWNWITTSTVGRARRGNGDFELLLCCPMCASRQQSRDKHYRCGIIHTAGGIGANCFNCGFKTRYTIGQPLSNSMFEFLCNIGVPEREVKKIRTLAWELSTLVTLATEKRPDFVLPQFAPAALPPGSKSLEEWADLGCDHPDYLAVVEYLLGRGEVATRATQYFWSPSVQHGINRKLIIPCYHHARLVGWIGRCIDPTKRKYYNSVPQHFLFNSNFLNHSYRKHIFVVEGIFDALVIDGVAVMGADLSDQQAHWINQSGKIPVVIPDRDETGKRLALRAIDLKWHVAIPNCGGRLWWRQHVKDVDEAVAVHGKLFTIQSIIASMTNDPISIKLRLKF